MGKSKTKKDRKLLSSTVKYLSFAPNSEIARSVIAGSNDSVVRAIANAALNAQQNESVRLTPAQRQLFATHKNDLEFLIDRNHSVQDKRKRILQKGGALPAVIIPLLASVLGTIGSSFISRAFGGRGEE